MIVELTTDEKSILIIRLGDSIRERIKWIRMWGIHKRSPYYMDIIPHHIKNAREEMKLLKKIAGKSYLDYLDFLIR